MVWSEIRYIYSWEDLSYDRLSFLQISCVRLFIWVLSNACFLVWISRVFYLPLRQQIFQKGSSFVLCLCTSWSICWPSFQDANKANMCLGFLLTVQHGDLQVIHCAEQNWDFSIIHSSFLGLTSKSEKPFFFLFPYYILSSSLNESDEAVFDQKGKKKKQKRKLSACHC